MPQKKNTTLDWKCRSCKLTAESILGDLANKTDWKGLHLVHERLCQGLSSNNEPLGLPSDCPACRKRIGKTRTPLGPISEAWENHWRKCQSGLPLSDTFGLHEIRIKFQKNLLPSINMNANFGFLSRRALILEDADLKTLAQELRADPVHASYRIDGLVMEYRKDFAKYFHGAIPVSFHNRTADIHPRTMMATILRLESLRKSSNKTVTDIERQSCGLAIVEGSYGAGNGTMTQYSASAIARKVSCGPDPHILLRKDLKDWRNVESKLKSWKEEGTFGLVVEMVSSRDGQILEPIEWQVLTETCHKLGIYLVVDETQTAIRSGAPFAHQLAQYMEVSSMRPSFVLFGEGLRACGLAVYPDGVTISKLGYVEQDVMRILKDYHDSMYSEMINHEVLMESWAIIRTAKWDSWTTRAAAIGENLRRVLSEVIKPSTQSFQYNTQPRGLGALLYIDPEQAAKVCAPGASARIPTMGWFPFLDESMENWETVWALFGPHPASLGVQLRQILERGYFDQQQWECVICSDTLGSEGWERCDRCKESICSSCLENRKIIIRWHRKGLCLG